MRLLSLVYLFSYVLFTNDTLPEKKYQITGFAQGTTYHITYFSDDSIVSKNNIDSILNSLDSSLSIYKPYSIISRFNLSDSGCAIDNHLQIVLTKSLQVYNETKGIFDVTVLPLVKAWGFGSHEILQPPDSEKIVLLKQCIGASHLDLVNYFLLKDKSCIQLDVDGIAQGYSVDVIADFLESKNIQNYIAELGGEIRVKGTKPDGSKMKIGIEAPDDEESNRVIEQVVELESGAITTSGSYRKFHESNGKRLTHIIDPRTGYPIQNEMVSASVFAKDALTADAYDNVLMVMGVDSALNFINQKKDLAAFIIYKNPDGTLADTASQNFYNLLKK